MIHYVYKTTNLLNGKFYIGVKTNSRHYDDGYFGSGLLLNKAIKKLRLSCLGCRKETTVNANWRHKECL